MFFKSKFFRVSCALTLLLAMFSFVFADTIRLKDGSIIKGKIIGFSNGQFVVLIGEGARQRRMNFYADEIESIEFDSSSTPIASVNTNTQLPQRNTNTANTSANNSNTTVITVGQNTRPTPTPTPVSTPVPTPIPTPTPTRTNTSTANTEIIPANTSNTNRTNTNTATGNSTNTNTSTGAAPVRLNVRVLADNTSNGWTSSGWVAKKGQRIKITSRGNISLGNGKYSTPNGIPSLADKDKLMPQEATGGLIAVIGDDNNEFIFIGASKEFVATRDGLLFLGVNEGNLDDNSGSFEVTIEIVP